MRSSQGDLHISGAERLVRRSEIDSVGSELLLRAINHSRGTADQIRLSVDLVPAEQVRQIGLPPLQTLVVSDWQQGRRAALVALTDSGVSTRAADLALARLSAGAGPDGCSMRGAMLIDASSGRRLDADSVRGVRASRMDISPDALADLRRQLVPFNLDNSHVREALVLSAKVLAAPGLVAELCWSDDPEYTAGYVASPKLGYRRFPHLKAPGDARGGRVFFIRAATDLDELRFYLEKQPVLVTRVGECLPSEVWRGHA